ncbi:NAD-dependent epimerase/dehydratase family protein [Dongia deserti]|uniref:NAD-dependent epimerase/dehydratase family protein n=1 Tax=Dongia deserti TaxID=2268030 RepID=UPI000E649CDE|nr:NAD-dependent epimerase/dehydratase family protein [Dongia deserti]
MRERVLITGGAGFIGSHLCDALLAAGYDVRLYDNLNPQVHGNGAWPSYLTKHAELQCGDMRDAARLGRALEGIDDVVHLAASVGVGQSMYEIADYVGVNDCGTANLLQLLSKKPARKLVVASSMSVYGEGRYRTAPGAIVDNAVRSDGAIRAGAWDPVDERGEALVPIPTPEEKVPDLASVYALTKFSQERMCLLVGKAYGMSTVALRFFNVYGTRQALSNPYTGVLAIFASRLMNGNPPMIFEDGGQLRDFVHVRDVAQACRSAIEAAPTADGVYNVGTGRGVSIAELADRMRTLLGRPDLKPQLTGRYRIGDVRHCFAEIKKARHALGFDPKVGLNEGMAELVEWVRCEAPRDQVDFATRELSRRGLVA